MWIFTSVSCQTLPLSTLQPATVLNKDQDHRTSVGFTAFYDLLTQSPYLDILHRRRWSEDSEIHIGTAFPGWPYVGFKQLIDPSFLGQWLNLEEKPSDSHHPSLEKKTSVSLAWHGKISYENVDGTVIDPGQLKRTQNYDLMLGIIGTYQFNKVSFEGSSISVSPKSLFRVQQQDKLSLLIFPAISLNTGFYDDENILCEFTTFHSPDQGFYSLLTLGVSF